MTMTKRQGVMVIPLAVERCCSKMLIGLNTGIIG